MKRKYLPWLLLLRCVVFLLVFVVCSAVTKRAVADISNWWSIIATAVNIFTILLLVGISKKRNGSYRELIGLKKASAKEILLMTLAIVVIGMAGMYLAGFVCYGVISYAAPMMIAPISPPLAIANVLLLPVTTALAEEGLYLGCGVNSIKNKYAAVIVPSLLFALQHSFIPTLPDVTYIVYRFLSFLPLTVVLCLHYYIKRNPLPIMVGHAVIDVATVMQILATSMIPGLYEQMCAM